MSRIATLATIAKAAAVARSAGVACANASMGALGTDLSAAGWQKSLAENSTALQLVTSASAAGPYYERVLCSTLGIASGLPIDLYFDVKVGTGLNVCISPGVGGIYVNATTGALISATDVLFCNMIGVVNGRFRFHARTYTADATGYFWVFAANAVGALSGFASAGGETVEVTNIVISQRPRSLSLGQVTPTRLVLQGHSIAAADQVGAHPITNDLGAAGFGLFDCVNIATDGDSIWDIALNKIAATAAQLTGVDPILVMWACVNDVVRNDLFTVDQIETNCNTLADGIWALVPTAKIVWMQEISNDSSSMGYSTWAYFEARRQDLIARQAANWARRASIPPIVPPSSLMAPRACDDAGRFIETPGRHLRDLGQNEVTVAVWNHLAAYGLCPLRQP